MTSLLDVLPPEARSRLRKRRTQPDWVPPMLATLTDKKFSDPGWIFERKLDGERCLVFRRGKKARLMSRNEGTLNGQLVAQIGFSEWTSDGQLRHPRFMGLRTDKKPRDVVRERPS